MQDHEDILQLMKKESAYVPDEGFSQRVMQALPQTARYRHRVIGASWTLSLVSGAALWASGGPSLTLFSLQPAVWMSAATITFWGVLGLFIFVTKDEGILDI